MDDFSAVESEVAEKNALEQIRKSSFQREIRSLESTIEDSCSQERALTMKYRAMKAKREERAGRLAKPEEKEYQQTKGMILKVRQRTRTYRGKLERLLEEDRAREDSAALAPAGDRIGLLGLPGEEESEGDRLVRLGYRTGLGVDEAVKDAQRRELERVRRKVHQKRHLEREGEEEEEEEEEENVDDDEEEDEEDEGDEEEDEDIDKFERLKLGRRKKSQDTKLKKTKKKKERDDWIDVTKSDEDDEEDDRRAGGVEEGLLEELNRRDDGLLRHYEARLDVAEGCGSLGFVRGDGDVVFDEAFRLPESLHARLFEYQRTGVRWMWELHFQGAGGVIGDEMGLGKTVQLIAFLAGLERSELLDGPVLVACPATVLSQWVLEFHRWWAPFRVFVLHSSGSSAMPKARLLDEAFAERDFGRSIVLCTYGGLRAEAPLLLRRDWAYAVLDEGHAIRNPDAGVTLVAKRLRTRHRLVMTGAPIQNNLIELWSLFDFVYPGKLGTLPLFEREFSIPIVLGGHSHASSLQVQTAYHCARVLSDTVKPYLLRRLKADVRAQLPAKHEQVLFCRLTPLQRRLYREFLCSRQYELVRDGRMNLLSAITALRKICNHPDLPAAGGRGGLMSDRPKDGVEGHPDDPDDLDDLDDLGDDGGVRWIEEGEAFGSPAKSGKLSVLAHLLRGWRRAGDKVLVFSQTRQMLSLIERHVRREGMTYLRLDGNAAVGGRAALIDRFNDKDGGIFCFLLTTKVGGVGVNLTGANRVVIFDPDWNPSTDKQARERAWRIGQTREVVVYRLITAGTIEEKVYHRQIFKQYLTNKVLIDPSAERFVKFGGFRDLFELEEEGDQITETEAYFPEAVPGEVRRQAVDDDDNGSTERGEEEEEEIKGEEEEDRVDENERNRRKRRKRRVSNDDDGRQAGLLESLLQTHVKGMLEHDEVMSSARADDDIVAAEAQRAAERAADALRHCVRELRQAPVFAPTWTGLAGSAGRPQESSTILAALGESESPLEARRQRPSGRHLMGKEDLVDDADDADDAEDADEEERELASMKETSGEQAAREKKKFVIAVWKILKEGPRRTQDIIDVMSGLGLKADPLIYRTILQKIAILQDGVWSLKPDFFAD